VSRGVAYGAFSLREDIQSVFGHAAASASVSDFGRCLHNDISYPLAEHRC
jgi:hypothetical protein